MGGVADRGEERLLCERFTERDLPGLRVGVEECAASAGLAGERRGEFVLAVDAMITNAVEHGGGSGRLLLRRIGDELECEVADSGPGFTEEVIPELLPGLDGQAPGRGLWLARMLTDRLTVRPGADRSGEPVGAVVTLAVRLGGGEPTA